MKFTKKPLNKEWKANEKAVAMLIEKINSGFEMTEFYLKKIQKKTGCDIKVLREANKLLK